MEKNPAAAYLVLKKEEVPAMTATTIWMSWTRMCNDTPESEKQIVFRIPQAGLSLG